LRSSILIPVIAPMFMSVAITILADRKPNRCGGPPTSDSDGWRNGG
jgi:hypothetical protein